MREASLTRHFTPSARKAKEKKNFFSSPSSPASGKMPRSPRLAYKAPVMQAKSSVHRLVFNYYFSAFLLQTFSV